LNKREWIASLPLLFLMVWMGVYSQDFMPSISAQNAQILQQVNAGATAAVETPPPVNPSVNRAVREVADAR